MAIVAFYELVPVAIDNSANTAVRLVNTQDVRHIRYATASEGTQFGAQSAVIITEAKGNNFGRSITLLTATPYATLKTAFNV